MAKWISVKDRLPDEDGEYLCLTWLRCGAGKIPFYKVLSFTNNAECYFDLGFKGRAWYRYDSEWGNYAVDNVTHWMPLPEPPKEGE